MHRPVCASCRFNRRASEAADTIFAMLAVFFVAICGVQLWLVWLGRKAFPHTDECREHREPQRKS